MPSRLADLIAWLRLPADNAIRQYGDRLSEEQRRDCRWRFSSLAARITLARTAPLSLLTSTSAMAAT
jgi:hypothetical protein